MSTAGLSTVSGWKLDHFSTSDQKVDLDIDHNFWSVGNLGDTYGWVVGNITVKNTGTVLLKDVTIYLDVDDQSPEFDMHICDSNGKILDNTGPYGPSYSFGDIQPGATSGKVSYWWLVRPRFPGSQGSGTNPGQIVLYPTFTADFRQSGKSFTSNVTLNNS